MSRSSRGVNSAVPARLPALQASRISDPEVHRAVEALREWVEVRLGSRGDKYERAVTLREVEQLLAPIATITDALGQFNGSIGTLRTTKLAKLPDLRQGAFEQVGDDLYYCNGTAWKKVTLTVP